MKTFYLGGIGLLALATLGSTTMGGKKAAKLQGYDLLAPAYGAVTLQAKIERKGMMGINPDLEGRDVAFFFEGKELGRSKAGDDGIASFVWTPPRAERAPSPTAFEFQAAIPAESSYESAPAAFSVFFWDPQKPCVVIDLDGTVCASKEIEVGLKEPSELKAVEGAPEALREIAKNYNVLYLTARDDALMNATREWLTLRGFPRGPVLFRDLKLTNLSAESYKTKRLLELKQTWNLVAGCGDRDEDANAYMAAGMTAYLIGKPVKIPQGARKLVHWSEIEKLLRP